MRRRGLKKWWNFNIIRDTQGKPDVFFVALMSAIVGFGLLMLSSASSVVSYQKFSNSYYYISHQILFGLLPGLVLFTITSRIDYRRWRVWAFAFLVIAIVLLILIFIPGIGYEYGGARRWIHVGPFLFQPSEFVKLAFLLYLAAWLSTKGEKNVQDFSYGFLPFIFLLGAVALLVILQPDMGTMGIITLIAFAMYVVGGARYRHVALAGAGGLAAILLLIQAAPYRFDRFTTFLHPELDPLGIGYHINQALLAVGSGGLFGRGFGLSRQKYAYLPEVTGDSIFAVIAEELGFFLCILLIGLFVAFAVRGIRIAMRAPDTFGTYLATGIIAWVVFQAFINIGAMLALLPLTGIPLPLISYGGSAMMTLLGALGIVVNISRHSRT